MTKKRFKRQHIHYQKKLKATEKGKKEFKVGQARSCYSKWRFIVCSSKD